MKLLHALQKLLCWLRQKISFVWIFFNFFVILSVIFLFDLSTLIDAAYENLARASSLSPTIIWFFWVLLFSAIEEPRNWPVKHFCWLIFLAFELILIPFPAYHRNHGSLLNLVMLFQIIFFVIERWWQHVLLESWLVLLSINRRCLVVELQLLCSGPFDCRSARFLFILKICHRVGLHSQGCLNQPDLQLANLCVSRAQVSFEHLILLTHLHGFKQVFLCNFWWWHS